MKEGSQVVGGIIALLITIIIGIMLYFNVTGSIESFDERTEIFTGYSDGDNASAWSITLRNSPVDDSHTNVTCWSSTSSNLSFPTFGLSSRTIYVGADAAENFTQVNVTYTSNIADIESGATDMASTVFGLAPIIAVVVVAAVLLGIVLTFGKGGMKKGL